MPLTILVMRLLSGLPSVKCQDLINCFSEVTVDSPGALNFKKGLAWKVRGCCHKDDFLLWPVDFGLDGIQDGREGFNIPFLFAALIVLTCRRCLFKMKKLYLIDSSIYVFRAWFSLPDTIINEDGLANNAFLGFTDFVYQFLHSERPSQLVFTFDESLKHSQRNAIYPDYKANRAAAPEELKRQFRWCRDWLQALGITQVASNLYEADDLIGSLAKIHRAKNFKIVILTADKDLAQLIREHDVWWSFATGQQFSYRALMKKFGVKPEQIADQLALAGDKVDNIPGIPGVGMTIAARLLTKFETLENLRKNLDKVRTLKFRGSERIMNLLKEHDSILDMSSQLTPIDCEIADMEQVDIQQGEVKKESLIDMMKYHRMDRSRQEKWLQLADSGA